MFQRIKSLQPVSSAEAGSFIVGTLAISVVVVPVAFNFGVHGTIFFQNLMLIWAASVVALLARLFVGTTSDGQKFFTLTGGLLLALPSIWMASLVFGVPADSWVSQTLMYLTAFVSLPYILWVTMQAAAPDTLRIKSGRLIFGFVTIIVTLATLSMFAGYYNKYFLTCNDSSISGASEPPGCTKSFTTENEPIP